MGNGRGYRAAGGAAVPVRSTVEHEQEKKEKKAHEGLQKEKFNADDTSAPQSAGNLLKSGTGSLDERIESGVPGAGQHGTPQSNGTKVVAEPAETTMYRPDARQKATPGEKPLEADLDQAEREPKRTQ